MVGVVSNKPVSRDVHRAVERHITAQYVTAAKVVGTLQGMDHEGTKESIHILGDVKFVVLKGRHGHDFFLT